MIENPISKEEDDNLNSPKLDKSGKVTRKSITSSDQAYAIANKLEIDNRERNNLSAIIVKKYHGGQPHDPSALKANLEDWRSNAPTGFMSGIVDRITPAPIQAIDSARYLTSASLDDGTPESEKKSEFFRNEVTKTIRGWNGFRDFLAALCQEDVLIGRAAPANLDPFSPWPKMYRGDEIFFPEGTGQHARMVPLFSVKEDLLVSDFVDFLQDGPEISKDAGWDFDACIKVVNEALPKSKTTTKEGENARTWEDAIREGNRGAAQSGAKVIQLYHTLGIEPDTKKVTHFAVNRAGNHEQLFHKEERFEKAEDVVTLFCLQPGNGKYYGVRGVGSLLVNAHISIERTRNEMLDSLRVAGLKILKVPTNTTPSLEFKIAAPFMIVSGDGEFDEKSIESNVQNYIEADNQVAKWAEQMVGSYLPGLRGDNESPNITATEATIIANRDAQAKVAFLARFWGQFADLIGQITRRLCDPETTDESAKELQKKLIDPERGNMSKEEINKLANAPAAEVVMDLTQMHNEQIVRVYPTIATNPNVDQEKAIARYLSAAVNPQFAADVQLDKQGMLANESEQMRQQLLETEAILAGAPGMPVSPRDDDAIHLKVIFSDLKAGIPKVMQSAPQNPAILDHLNAQLVHSRAHIDSWKQKGAPPEELKPYEDAQKAFETVLHQIGEQMKSQMEQRQAPQGTMGAPKSSQTSPDAQTVSEPPPDDKEPTAQSGTMSEKVVTAWIAQYPDLSPLDRDRIEKISGLTIPMDVAPSGENIIPEQGAMASTAPRPPMLPRPPIAPVPPPAAPTQAPQVTQ